MLSKQKSEYGLRILASMVTKESDHLALASVVTSCQIQNDILRNAILEVLSRADQLSYRYKNSFHSFYIFVVKETNLNRFIIFFYSGHMVQHL